MKKLFLALLVVMMMGVSAMASAAPSNSSLLNEEEKITAKVFDAFAGKADYETAIKPYLTKGLAKNFSHAQFTKAKSESDKNFGKFVNPKLFTLQKFDKADRLFYIAGSSKAPAVEVGFVFDTTGAKVLLDGINMRPVEVKQAPAAAKK